MQLCLGFIPYLQNPRHMEFEEFQKSVETYFKIVEKVGILSVAGGEPLIHKDVSQMMAEIMKYRERIENSIDLVTNGTLPLKDSLIDVLSQNKDMVRIIINNYGKDLSKNVDDIIAVLEQNDIFYRVQNYEEDSDWTYDGWVDFRDHSLKHKTEEARLEQVRRCVFRRGHYYGISNGILHPCNRSYYRMESGIIDKDET